MKLLFNITPTNKKHTLGGDVILGMKMISISCFFSNSNYNNTIESLNYSFNDYVLNTYSSLYLCRKFTVYKAL